MGSGLIGKDQDALLAQLVGFLEPATYPIDELLSALDAASGDVARAAEELLTASPSVKRRKLHRDLAGWLSQKPRRSPVESPRRRSIEKAQKHELDEATIDATPAAKSGSSAAWDSLLRRDAPPPKSKTTPQPPIRLATQAAIDAHSLPLTILQSPLTSSFASALYLSMMAESAKWDPNRFYLAGKWVESPHTTTSYKRPDAYEPHDIALHNGAVAVTVTKEVPERDPKWYYSGTELDAPSDYPEMLRRAAEIVEPVVNAAIAKRGRYPLEWAGRWRANVCGANRYDGAASSVGWHADQLTCALLPSGGRGSSSADLGPYTTIASLSLGTSRAFRVRQTDPVDQAYASSKPIRTYEVTLPHNSPSPHECRLPGTLQTYVSARGTPELNVGSRQ